MKDEGICPYCHEKISIWEYGYGFVCPECNGKIDVFPDMTYIETKLGMIGLPGTWFGFIVKLLGMNKS